MVARKPAYLMAGMAVLVVALAVLGTFHGKGRIDPVPQAPIAHTAFNSSGLSTPAPVVHNLYGWYTDGASNTSPDKDSREH